MVTHIVVPSQSAGISTPTETVALEPWWPEIQLAIELVDIYSHDN